MKYNNNSNEKEYNKKGEGKEKNPVMHNAIAHHPLTDARPAIHPSWPTPPPPLYILGMMFYGMEYPFG